MKLCILQPAYLPWLGFLERVARCDECVLLDHVQIDRNSKTKFASRNRVRTQQGWTWLSVPLKTKGRSDELELERIEIEEDGRWRAKHRACIEQSYARAPYLKEHRPLLERLYAQPWERLVPLANASLEYLLEAYDIRTPLVSSASLGCREQKSALILELCRARGATHYLSGPFGRDYLDAAAFASAGIELEFHDHVPPVYAQAHAGFEPGLSAIDLLFNHGPRAREILLSARSSELAA